MLQVERVGSKRIGANAIMGSIMMARQTPAMSFKDNEKRHCGYGDWSDWENEPVLDFNQWEDHSSGPPK